MRFKTAQLLELAEITKEQLRHWKQALPPISGRDGRKAHYSLEEVAALAVIAKADRQLTCDVSLFTTHAEALFAQVAEHMKHDDQPLVLCVNKDRMTVGVWNRLPDMEAMMLIQLQPIMSRLRDALQAATARRDQTRQFDLFGA